MQYSFIYSALLLEPPAIHFQNFIICFLTCPFVGLMYCVWNSIIVLRWLLCGVVKLCSYPFDKVFIPYKIGNWKQECIPIALCGYKRWTIRRKKRFWNNVSPYKPNEYVTEKSLPNKQDREDGRVVTWKAVLLVWMQRWGSLSLPRKTYFLRFCCILKWSVCLLGWGKCSGCLCSAGRVLGDTSG